MAEGDASHGGEPATYEGSGSKCELWKMWLVFQCLSGWCAVYTMHVRRDRSFNKSTDTQLHVRRDRSFNKSTDTQLHVRRDRSFNESTDTQLREELAERERDWHQELISIRQKVRSHLTCTPLTHSFLLFLGGG